MVCEMAAGSDLKDLKEQIVSNLGLNANKYVCKLVCRNSVLADENLFVSDLPSPRVTLILEKVALEYSSRT